MAFDETAGRGCGAPLVRTSSVKKLSPSPSDAATVSHSDSVGSRMPVQWANASAS